MTSKSGVRQQTQSTTKQSIEDPWVCVLCRRICHYRGLGDLYGPYNIDLTDSKTAKNKPDSGDLEAKVEKSNRSSNASSNSLLQKSPSNSAPVAPNTTLTNPKKTKKSRYSLLANYSLNTNNNVQEIWVHEDCLVWSEGVHIVGKQILKMEEVIRDSFHHNCSLCKKKGATIGCSGKRCRRKFHFICARDDPKCFLDDANFALKCDKCSANQATSNSQVSTND